MQSLCRLIMQKPYGMFTQASRGFSAIAAGFFLLVDQFVSSAVINTYV